MEKFKRSLLLLSSFLLIFGLSIQGHAAAGKTCASNYLNEEARLETLKNEMDTFDASSAEKKAYNSWKRASGKKKVLREIINERTLLEILSNYEMVTFRKRLAAIIDTVSKSRGTTSIPDRLAKAFEEEIQSSVLKRTLKDRLNPIRKGEALSPEQLRRALGDMTLEEVQELTYGKNPLRPSADSLVGQYLKETGATTIRRRFKRTRTGGNNGVEKLVVAVSQRSFNQYKALFARPEFIAHVHTPQQGTLLVAHNGKAGSYGRLSETLRTPRVGTLMPHILLKTTEGQRAANFFKLAGIDQSVALEPWNLKKQKSNDRTESYCATGGYNSCTHWIGNVPVGDLTVDAFSFPGKVDEHAYNSVSRGVQKRKLKPYDPGFEEYSYGHSNRSEDVQRLIQTVWKVPGNQQLSDVIGLHSSNVAGELASPGYVALSLTGRASNQRVPVVFLVVSDHKAPIERNFDPEMEVY